jgi:RimJ/RimL family protein N-acetyltransferase
MSKASGEYLDRPFLVGERIYLRPLEVEDVTEEYLQWMNDASLAKFIPAMTFPGTRQAVQDYVARESRRADVVFLAIVDKESGRHVGNIKLGPVSWVDRRADYGRLIGDPTARSKGYGSEAVRLILRYAFDILNLHKVGASCLASNAAAIRSNEKSGLTREGVLREHRFVEGRYEDVLFLGITRDEYRARYAQGTGAPQPGAGANPE